MTGAVEVARRWIGTPYMHQMSVLGAGTDCLGLIRGVWREVEGREPLEVPPYTPDWSEPHRAEVLFDAARTLMTEVAHTSGWAHGQVLLFRMRDGSVAKHLGVLACDRTNPTFIHAYSGHGVVESVLSSPWRRRVAARFTFPSHLFSQE